MCSSVCVILYVIDRESRWLNACLYVYIQPLLYEQDATQGQFFSVF